MTSMPSYNAGLPAQYSKGGDASPEADIVNKFHKHSDVDSSALAQHHTLGNKANQAAAGNHNHSGIDSPVIKGLESLEKLADETVTGSLEDGSALSDLLDIFSRIFGLQDSTNTYTGLSFGEISNRMTSLESATISGKLEDGSALNYLLGVFHIVFGMTLNITPYAGRSLPTLDSALAAVETDLSTGLLSGVTLTGTTDTEKIDSIIAALVTLGATDGTT